MDNLKIGVFDLFSSTIPGIPLLILCGFISYKESFDLKILFDYLQSINIITFLLLLVISYCIGFSFQYISYEVFKFLAKSKVFKKRIGKHPINIGKRGDKITLIRHYSPENFKVLNTFFALRAMCYNMFFSLFVFFIGTLISVIIFKINKWEINCILILSILFSYLFFRRAISFQEWIQNMISECKTITKREFKNLN